MELEMFKYNDQLVRTVVEDGEPWFVLADLCKILDISQPHRVAARLEDDQKGRHLMTTPGGNQVLTTVNESGMYDVILRSDKAEAKPFRRWVTAEVLPSIRKTGGYSVSSQAPVLTDEQIVAQALQITAQKVAALEAVVTEQAPKVEFFDHCVSHDDAMTVKDWGAQFGVGEREARALLVEANIIYRKHIGRRWSDKRGKLGDEYEYRARDGRVTYDWFTLRGQHAVARHHNGQLRQTLYVRGDRALDLAKKVGMSVQAVLEVA